MATNYGMSNTSVNEVGRNKTETKKYLVRHSEINW